jgi:hypothetical protein
MTYEIKSLSTIEIPAENEENTVNQAMISLIEKNDLGKSSAPAITPLELDHKKSWWAQAMVQHQKWINEGGFYQFGNALVPQTRPITSIQQIIDENLSSEKQSDYFGANVTPMWK